jgi:hypothetical protein
LKRRSLVRLAIAANRIRLEQVEESASDRLLIDLIYLAIRMVCGASETGDHDEEGN